MQWDDSENAGFTTGIPWLKVNPNYTSINVDRQLTDENSVLSYYKKLLALRKSAEYKDVLTYGTFTPLFENEENIFAYERRLNDKSVIILANFGDKEAILHFKKTATLSILLNNLEKAFIKENEIILLPCQVIVAQCN